MDFGNPPPIIQDPPKSWLRRLVRDSVVWLVKENTRAIVTWPFAHATGACGELCIRIRPGQEQTWYVSEDGNGLDGKRLMLPCAPLPETEAPLANDDTVLRELCNLRKRIKKIENALHVNEDPFKVSGLYCDPDHGICKVINDLSEIDSPTRWDVMRGDTEAELVTVIDAKDENDAFERAVRGWGNAYQLELIKQFDETNGSAHLQEPINVENDQYTEVWVRPHKGK